MSGWRWYRPSLQLHPAHVELESGCIQPLGLHVAELLLSQDMAPSALVAQVASRMIVVFQHAGSEAVLMRLPLLGLEVSYVQDPSGEDQPLITVKASSEDQMWLFKSREGVEAASNLLELMGACGAVRKDLSLSLEPKLLDTGATASVRKATSSFQGSEQVCIVKTFHEGEDSKVRARIIQEQAILSQAQGSPYIVRTRGLWSEGEVPQYSLLMEYCAGGDARMATRQQPYREAVALDIACDVLQGLSHLHRLGIIHRDIKPANIFFRTGGQVVIADLGLSCRDTDVQAVLKRSGTPGFVAPEIIKGKGASTKSDIFGTGSTLYYLLSGKLPFSRPGDESNTVLARTMKENLNFSDPLFAFVSMTCKGFLKKLTKKAPSARPCAAQALALQYHLSNSEGTSTDVEEERVTRFSPRATGQLSVIESLPSLQELPVQGRSFSTALARADSDSERSTEPVVIPRSLTVRAWPVTSQPPQAARSLTSDP